jgi:2,4-dienoyl-CoA reductase-like NADH-dependent reductase (Old Yellow Enzyme family)
MKLFETGALGPLTLRNRIVMPPMATLFGNQDGTVSPRLLAYYSRRARGGAGLIVVENTAIHPRGINYTGTLEIHHERFERGLAELASAIKQHGAAAAIQLFHPGRQVHPKYAGNYPVAPSPIPCPVMGGKPHALTVEEIRKLVKRFVAGAVRA